MKAIHSRTKGGFIGDIPDRDTFDKLLQNEVGWEEHVDNKMVAVKLPVDIFWELVALKIAYDEGYLIKKEADADESLP